ncbi:hypothetical protein [Exiguobacterium undae]
MRKFWMICLLATFSLSGCLATQKETVTVTPLKLKAGEQAFAQINDQDIAAFHLKGKLKKPYLLKGVEYLPNHKERTLFSMEIPAKTYDSTLRIVQSSSAKYTRFGANLNGVSLRSHEALKIKPDAVTTKKPSSEFTLTNYNVLFFRQLSESENLSSNSFNDIQGPENVTVKKGEQIFAFVLTEQN